MRLLKGVHHIAIICSDYQKSKYFYTTILGFTIVREVYREERQSYKLDLALNGEYIIELFSFPNPPKRVSQPEASGLRHLAFSVDDIELAIKELSSQYIIVEPIRVDEFTGKKFTFFSDPDGLPIELYEVSG
jgi:glyoxylase I family protein